jgi:hypothetical protein
MKYSPFISDSRRLSFAGPEVGSGKVAAPVTFQAQPVSSPAPPALSNGAS